MFDNLGTNYKSNFDYKLEFLRFWHLHLVWMQSSNYWAHRSCIYIQRNADDYLFECLICDRNCATGWFNLHDLKL